MCGIAGFVANLPDSDANEILGRMLSRIVHRGPDHTGQLISQGVGLGNTRLKIIDIENGNQPIYNEDRTVAVVYNGEIYNFRELRDELIRKSHVFATNTDTEVIVHMYEEYGLNFIQKLNGIFAFALYDFRNGFVYIARDRFGVKPLYYRKFDDGIYFGSEINALKATPNFSAELDFEALGIYLDIGYFPQPWTSFKHVKKLEAGHYLAVDVKTGKVEDVTYYRLDYSKKTDDSREEIEHKVINLLEASIKRQLISDVPVGLFLSGGVDSCSLLALLSSMGVQIDSFTLTFGDERLDESSEASRWAQYFGSRHHQYKMSEADLISSIEKRIDGFGEPLGPWINCGQSLIAKYAYEQGFKVMFSGAGGDELFCGYPTLNAAMFARVYRSMPDYFIKRPAKHLAGLVRNNGKNLSFSYKIKSFVDAIGPCNLQTFLNFKSIVPETMLRDLLTRDVYEEIVKHKSDKSPLVAKYEREVSGLPFIDALQYLDMKIFLEGSILTGGDSAAMAASVEERVPFLDNELVEYALKIPVNEKFRLFGQKTLFKSAFRAFLRERDMEGVLKKTPKKGYWLPANEWLKRGRMNSYLENRLSAESLGRTNFFSPKFVKSLMESHVSGRHRNDRILQSVLGLQHFLESNERLGI